MHIAIIGSGISGLSLYLWLQKLGLTAVHSVTIYEARSATPATAEDTDSNQIPNASFIGGALGFSPIGLRILRRLDPELEQEILRTGHWMGRWKLSNARGWFFGETQVAENGGGVLVGRAAFWQCLRRRVPDFALIGLKKVLEVLPGDARQGSKCKVVFEDGAETQADLVAGCDGVWSRVRTAVLGEEVKPIYHGLTGVGGFVGSDKLEGVEDGEMLSLARTDSSDTGIVLPKPLTLRSTGVKAPGGRHIRSQSVHQIGARSTATMPSANS
jgi:2-polyprenyl-6-methoxyphenol hydroxylase-like FAD-dependent oxidoreductase